MMEDKWAALHQKEQILLQEESELQQVEQHLKEIQDEAEQFFHQGSYLLEDICMMFRNDEERFIYQNILDDFSIQSRQSLEELEDTYQEYYQKRKKVEEDIEEVFYEKRKIALAEEE